MYPHGSLHALSLLVLAALPSSGCIAWGYGDVRVSEEVDGPGGGARDEGGVSSGDSGYGSDSGTDASTAEAGPDGGSDAAANGSPDGALDAASDGSSAEAGFDGGSDADVNGGDASVEGKSDASVDASHVGDGGDAGDAGDGAVECPVPCGAGSFCEAGTCVPASCEEGLAECDGDGDTICETHTTADPLHCGACGQVCPANGGTPICVSSECDTRCDLTGTFALKLTAPTTWPTSGQVGSGSGTFVFWLRVRATHEGDELAVQLLECGQSIPVIHAWLPNEDHLFVYPDELYEAEVLSSTSATIAVGDSSPDAPLDLPLVALQLGIDLDDPQNDPWPSVAGAVDTELRVDADADGRPGVTAHYVNAGDYEYPRTSASLFGERAAQAHVGVRWRFSMNGALTSCDTSEGDASVASVETRVYGCRHADGSLCSSGEANHLDTNLPNFEFGDGDYELAKIADDAPCSAVRAALP